MSLPFLLIVYYRFIRKRGWRRHTCAGRVSLAGNFKYCNTVFFYTRGYKALGLQGMSDVRVCRYMRKLRIDQESNKEFN